MRGEARGGGEVRGEAEEEEEERLHSPALVQVGSAKGEAKAELFATTQVGVL